MNAAGIEDSLEQLGDCLSDLSKNLQPLLTSTLSETTKKLPLLDRAQLYVTIVYAIESLLFSYLRLQGVDAKEHNVMKEIKRVQQYFAKVKTAEESGMKRDMTLNKPAANRMIKHALAGNAKVDLEYAERRAKELLVAKKKLQELEERKRQRELQAASSSSPATPAANGSSVQSPEVDASTMATAVAQITEEVEAAMTAAAGKVERLTPESPAPSEGSTTSSRKSKKRRLQDGQGDSPSSNKKKKKRKQAGAAGADGADS